MSTKEGEMKKKKPTVKGYRDILNFGTDVERVEVLVHKKKKIFAKKVTDRIVYTKGTKAARIIYEDACMFGK